MSYPENQPRNVKKIIAEIILFSDIQIKNGDEITIRYGTSEKKCKGQRILYELTLSTSQSVPNFQFFISLTSGL